MNVKILNSLTETPTTSYCSWEPRRQVIKRLRKRGRQDWWAQRAGTQSSKSPNWGNPHQFTRPFHTFLTFFEII
jgi:hypothetical protein